MKELIAEAHQEIYIKQEMKKKKIDWPELDMVQSD